MMSGNRNKHPPVNRPTIASASRASLSACNQARQKPSDHGGDTAVVGTGQARYPGMRDMTGKFKAPAQTTRHTVAGTQLTYHRENKHDGGSRHKYHGVDVGQYDSDFRHHEFDVEQRGWYVGQGGLEIGQGLHDLDRMPDSTSYPERWSSSPQQMEGEGFRDHSRLHDSRSMPSRTQESAQCQPLPQHDGQSNLNFYRNKMESLPHPGFKIEEMLKWKKDYKLLNEHVYYMQWLFPTPYTSSVNLYAQPLQNEEAQTIQSEPKLMKRFLKAFELMLDFYGMKLNQKTGEISHAKNFKERVQCFNGWNNHSKITRILTSLGCLGQEKLQLAWLYYILYEMFDRSSLPWINENTMTHWIDAVTNEDEKMILFDRYHDWRRRMLMESELSYRTELTNFGTSVDGDAFCSMEAVPLDWNDDRKAETEDKVTPSVHRQCSMEVPVSPVENKDGRSVDVRPGSMKQEEGMEKKVEKKAKTSVFHRLFGGDSSVDREASSRRLNANVEFYSNKKRCNQFLSMFGDHIEDMLKWKGDYYKLESNHRYIQWLFPVPGSSGMNPSAQPLQEHEAEVIRSSPELKGRVQRAFEMMLDFYGMRLKSRETGEIERSKNWRERYHHLNRSMHNYRRISRIIKSLGHLGFPHYQRPWLTFILHEVLIHNTLPNLNRPDCGPIRQWIWAISDEVERQEMFMTYYELSGQITQANAERTLPKPDCIEDSEPSDDEDGNSPVEPPKDLPSWCKTKASPASTSSQVPTSLQVQTSSQKEPVQSHSHLDQNRDRDYDPNRWMSDAQNIPDRLHDSSSQALAAMSYKPRMCPQPDYLGQPVTSERPLPPRPSETTQYGYNYNVNQPATAGRPLPPRPNPAPTGPIGNHRRGGDSTLQESRNRSSAPTSKNVQLQHNAGPPTKGLYS